MKVIFLDINGVMALRYSGSLEENCLIQLKRIHEETGCLIILASSWRSNPRRIAKVDSHFDQHGIPRLIGRTGFKMHRGEEILEWINTWNLAVESGANFESILFSQADSPQLRDHG